MAVQGINNIVPPTNPIRGTKRSHIEVVQSGIDKNNPSASSKQAIKSILNVEGDTVGTTNTQTLTNKTYLGNGAGITDLDGDAVTTGTVAAGRLPALNAITAPAADVAMNSKKITGLAAPEDDDDAATMEYVDDAAAGLRESFTTTIESGNTHYDVEHNLGRHPMVQVFEGDSPGIQLDCEVTHVSTTTTRLTFAGTSPTTATAEFR
tara:strand:- start:1142 stop:1762 length:621 start_codon:yes stop_codon:yes gene_type:complete